MNRSWKTTLGGALAGLGTFLWGIPLALKQLDVTLPQEVSKWSILVGIVASALGVFFTGLFGRDNNVSSASLGISQNPDKPDPKQPN